MNLFCSVVILLSLDVATGSAVGEELQEQHNQP